MSVVKVLLVLFVLLFLVGRIRLGGGGEYSAEGVKAHLRVGPFRFQVFPGKAKGSKKERKKPKKKKPPEEKEVPESKAGGAIELVKAFLPLVCEAAGELKRRIRIDMLRLDYTAGGRDAAQTAMAFGGSNAVIGMILPLFQQNFDLKEYQVRTAMDFAAKGPTIYIYAAFSARLGQLLSVGIRFGWKFLMAYRKQKNMKKEAI